jgi:thioredoxin reductase (NADPH)
LILRRVAILQSGVGGPIILGRAENGDVLRLEGFLRRNGQPHQILNPETDAPAKALIDRFHIDPGQLPIVLCPNGQFLPARTNWRAASAWCDRSIQIASMT